MRRRFLIASLCGWMLCAALTAGLRQSPDPLLQRSSSGSLPVNVLLFTIDSCNVSRMSLYGNPIATTPNLDRWARRSTVFDRAYGVSAWTAPGLVSVLSGFLPGVHGVDSRDRTAPGNLPTLLKAFKAAGYEVPNLNFFTFAPYYRNLGLPEVDNRYFGTEDGEELLRYLEQNFERPFFIWYHTTKVHQPYNPPAEILESMAALHRLASAGEGGPAASASEDPFASPGIQAVRRGAIVPRGSVSFTSADRPALHALYDGNLHAMDAFFGRAIHLLESKGVADRTLVVVTADHGEELLEHGFIGHASTSLNAKLYDEIAHIPLILHQPGQTTGSRVAVPVQQIDVAPSILELAGLPGSPRTQGRSLVSLLPRLPGNARPEGAPPRTSETGSTPARPPGSAPPMDRSGRGSLYFESVVAGNQTTKEREQIWVRAVRTKEFKYIRQFEGSRATQEMLFDVRADPRESEDLSKKRPGLVARFRKQVEAMHRDNERLRSALFKQEKRPPMADPGSGACPDMQMPQENQSLDYAQHTGAVLLQWSGEPGARYVVDYDIGLGDHHVAGQYAVTGNYQVLGPFPPDLWVSLKAWNPFKVRVSYQGRECWSPWRTFQF